MVLPDETTHFMIGMTDWDVGASYFGVSYSRNSDMKVFERYFLGDEFTIRGYNVRAISARTGLELEHGFNNTRMDRRMPEFARFVSQAPIAFVQATPSEGSVPRKDILFWVSLFGMIISPISTASTIIIAWISIRRSKADALLRQAQIMKMELEMEQLRLEIKRAQEETAQPKPLIFLATS